MSLAATNHEKLLKLLLTLQLHALLDLHSKIHRDTIQTISIYFKVSLANKAFNHFLISTLLPSSPSSLVTGTVALVFSAIGVLTSGIVISKFKPRARYLAVWNVFVGALSVFGMISYAYLGCTENENSVVINNPLA